MRLPHLALVVIGSYAPFLGGCGGAVGADPGFEAVVLSGQEADLVSTMYACFEGREPMKLGVTAQDSLAPYALSPQSHYLALDTGKGGVDIVTTRDGSVRHLADGATVQGMRWSNDETRLAYFSNGMPALADGDGSHPLVIGMSLPAVVGDYSFQDAEWSSDASMAAFVTRGRAVLVDAGSGDARVFSERAIIEYGTPWSMAFTPDGTHVALLQTDGFANRTVLLTRTDTFESREVAGIDHSALLGWSIDGNWLSVADTAFRLWLVPGSGDGAVEVGGRGRLSPVGPEVAFLAQADESLHVRSLGEMQDRVVTTPATGYVQWAPNGSALAYSLPGAGSAVVSTNDGRVLVPNANWITFGPDDSIARTDTIDDEQMLTIQHTGTGKTVTVVTNSFNIASDQFAWLSEGRFGFVSDGTLRVVKLDGTEARVSCPDVRGFVMPQDERL